MGLAAQPLETRTTIKASLNDFREIAILQTAFLGDVALALYLAATVKNANPGCKLYFITTPQSEPIVKHCTAIDDTIVYDKKEEHRNPGGILEISRKLKANGVECIITPHRSLRSGIVSVISGAKFKSTFNRNPLAFLFDNSTKYEKYSHEIARNHSLLSCFKEYPDLRIEHPEFAFFNEDVKYVNNLLDTNNLNGKKLIALAPGSVWLTKRWGDDKYAALSKMVKDAGLEPVFIGAEKDCDHKDMLLCESKGITLCGKTTIPQTLILLSRCVATVSNDSAPSHFSELVKTPVVTIYGPTIPEFGFSPVLENSDYAQVEGLKCKPCHIHGLNRCPEKTHDCMKNLDAGLVFNKLKNVVGV